MKIIRRVAIGVLALAFLGLFLWSRNTKEEEVAVPKPETEFQVVTAPDQSEPMEHEHFAVKEYVSELPSGTNIALDGTIEANNHNGQYTPMKANDGSTDGSSYWEGAANEYPSTLTLCLDKVTKVHGIRLCLNPAAIWGDRKQTFSVLVSSDGENYTELIPSTEYAFSPTTGNELILNFDEISCSFLQLNFTANTGATGAQVAEFEVYAP